MGAAEVDDEYQSVSRSKLNLKIDSGVSKKKHKKSKKHKDKDKDKDKELPSTHSTAAGGTTSQTHNKPHKTKAELAFVKMQEKMQKERISQKAAMTHKERVEKFNQHLDSLTEHFDIPKVSWTK